jgi:hypothetical protein
MSFENIHSDKFTDYLQGVRRDTRYTFDTLHEYADQLLAIYQEELIYIDNFRETNINTDENLKLLKTNKIKISDQYDVYNKVMTVKADFKTQTKLHNLYVLSNKLREREELIKSMVREIEVIVKRTKYLQEKNVTKCL